MALLFFFTISLTLSKSAFTLLLAGLMSSLPWYLRTFCPRKSKLSAMLVILVFSSESSSPRVRPPEVEDRLMPGHWEGDLIKGKDNASAVGTLVERSSGYLMLVKMNDATATSAVGGFSAALNRMPLAARKSLTYDQGVTLEKMRLPRNPE